MKSPFTSTSKTYSNNDSVTSTERKDDEISFHPSVGIGIAKNQASIGTVEKSNQHDPNVQSLQNYVIEKLNEELSNLRVLVEDEKEQRRQLVHVYESKISKLEESKMDVDQLFEEQQDHYWFGCGKCQRQVDEANKKLKVLERQYNQLLMEQQTGR